MQASERFGNGTTAGSEYLSYILLVLYKVTIWNALIYEDRYTRGISCSSNGRVMGLILKLNTVDALWFSVCQLQKHKCASYQS